MPFNRQIKMCQNIYHMHVRMVILLPCRQQLNTLFGAKLPNSMTANISGYTVDSLAKPFAFE